MVSTFGLYIKNLRKLNKLTLTQLGARLLIDSGALSKIENGKRPFDERKISLLAEIFNLDINEIKSEYFSEKIAFQLIENQCSERTLSLAQDKIKILKLQNFTTE